MIIWVKLRFIELLSVRPFGYNCKTWHRTTQLYLREITIWLWIVIPIPRLIFQNRNCNYLILVFRLWSGVNPTKLFSSYYKHFFCFLAFKFDCFRLNKICSNVTKWKHLSAKIGKRRKTKFARIDIWSKVSHIDYFEFAMIKKYRKNGP